MDKKIDIDDLLSEWALRSPDGLVGGHDTPENMAVLNEILTERGRKAGSIGKKFLQPYDPKDAGSNPYQDPSKWYVTNHRKIKDGTPLSDLVGTKTTAQKEKLPPPAQDEADKKREELSLYDPKNPSIAWFQPYYGEWVTTEDHPTYEPYTSYLDVKLNRSQGRKKSSSSADFGVVTRGRAAYLSYGWDPKLIEETKKFNATSASKIYNALLTELNAAAQKDFLINGYDKLTPENAIEFINNRFGAYAKFIVALDNARSTAGKKSTDDDGTEGSGAGSRAGRGEFILTLLIKGATSRGGGSGDIEYEGKNIEVKEIQNNIMRVSKTAFGGSSGFNRLKYIAMINQLANFCNMKSITGGSKYPTRGSVLRELCDKSPIWGKYEKYKTAALDFFEDPSLESLRGNTIYGLEIFSSYIRNLNEEEEKQIEQNVEKSIVPNTVEFDLNKKTTVMQIQNMPPESKAVVLNPSQDENPKQVSMVVAPITKDEDEGSKLVIPAAKRLEIFKYAGSKDKIYTPMKVAEDMFEAMQQGSYTGGIIFFEAESGFYYESDLSNLKHGDWFFYVYAQSGPSFKRDTPEELKK